MTGENSFSFNEATMIEIVQYWLDNKMLNPNESSPRVVSVSSGSHYCSEFTIKVHAKEPGTASK